MFLQKINIINAIKYNYFYLQLTQIYKKLIFDLIYFRIKFNIHSIYN